MSKEKIILSFIATFIGLIVAGGGFYLYQRTKEISPKNLGPVAFVTPTPKEESSFFLAVTSPEDEEVISKKVVEVQGKTNRDATISIVTSVDEEVVNPDRDGNFATTITIGQGQTIIYISAILPNGEEKRVLRTVTFSTEEF